jgi:tetratricopeptide (TPR) repeat protein
MADTFSSLKIAASTPPDDPTAEVEVIVRRFREAWQTDVIPSIDEYLPPGPAGRQATLSALVQADMECANQTGETVRLDPYLERYPELLDDRAVLLALLQVEFCVRFQREPELSISEYEARFPGLGHLLRRPVTAFTSMMSLAIGPEPQAEAAPPPMSSTSLGTKQLPSEAPVAGETDKPEQAALDTPKVSRPRQPAPPAPPPKPPSSASAGTMSRLNVAAAPVSQASRQTPRLPVTPVGPGGRPVEKPRPSIPGYDILSELGRGGMGVVYKARHIQLRRFVALKMILGGPQSSPDDDVRFLNEARAVASLKNPNIVQIYEVGEHEGRPFFSLEYLEGGSLDKKIKGTVMAEGEAARLMETLARAVHVAHGQNIIHRDLKPGNVLLDADGTPKITDFGLAKKLDADGSLSLPGDVMGTPNYMSPEQAEGRAGDIGPTADVYSLGAMLYELLTGRPPFVGENARVTLALLVSTDAVPPRQLQPKLHRDIETICMKCLEKDPRRRYASALEMAEDLKRFIEGEPIHARPIRTWEKGLRWAKRHPAYTAAAAVLVLTFLVVGPVGAILNFERQQAKVAGLQADIDRERAENVAREKQRDLEKQKTDTQARVQGRIQDGQEALKAQQWEKAAPLFEAAFKDSEANGLNAELGQAKDGLRKLEERTQAVKRKNDFELARDEAMFRALTSAGQGPDAAQKAVREKVTAALAILGVDLKAATPLDLNSTYSKPEREKLTQDCYELLLVLADTLAQPLPQQAAQDYRVQLQDALALLNRATQLGPETPQTQAIHLRRFRYLQALAEGSDDDKARIQRHNQALDEQRLAEQVQPERASIRLNSYLLGDDAYRQGNTEEARNKLETALGYDPEDFWSRYFLARSFVIAPEERESDEQRLDRLNRAKLQLDECLNMKTRPVQAEAWIYLVRGFVKGQMGPEHYQEAEKDFTQAAETLKNRPDPYAEYVRSNNRAVILAFQGKFDDCIKVLREAADANPRQYEAALSLAQAYQRKGDLTQAGEAFDGAVQKARQLAKDSNLEPARLAELLRLRALFRQGRTMEHRKNNQPEQAAEDIKGALQDYASAVGVLLPDGRLLSASIEDRRTLALVEASHGRLLQREKRPEEAARAYELALKAEPRQVHLHRLRGNALLDLKRYEEAVRAFDQYLQRGFFRYPIQVGGLFALAGADAVQMLPVLAVKQEFRLGGRRVANAHRARALALTRLLRYGPAIEDYTYALEIEPDDWRTYGLRGRAYLAAKAFALAADDFDHAIRLYPSEPDIYVGRGLARVKLGDVTLAVEDAGSALRLAEQADAARAAQSIEERGQERSTSTLMHQLAHIYAQAVGEPDTTKGRRPAPPNPRRSDYVAKALFLVRRAVELKPPAERASFWRQFIQFDRALDPIRGTVEFGQMDTEYGKTVAELLRDADAEVRRSPNVPGVLLDAARSYLQAAAYLGAGAGPGEVRVRREQARYRDQAAEWLGRAVENVPGPGRVEFWRSVIEPDGRFESIRDSRKYRLLAERCDPRARVSAR